MKTDTLSGQFVVLEAVYGSSGEVERFGADFEQHCEGATPALFGSIRFNSTIGFVPQLAVTANGSHVPVAVKIGESVSLQVSLEPGDYAGQTAEYWLGRTGPGDSAWRRSVRSGVDRWVNSPGPLLWKTVPLATLAETIQWTPDKEGVFLFQFVIDRTLDKTLSTEFVASVVVTVLPAETTAETRNKR